jgi:hypothetical protein
MIWIYPTSVDRKNIKGKNIKSKKRGKSKCQMIKRSKKNTLVCSHLHSSSMLSAFLYPIFPDSELLPIFFFDTYLSIFSLFDETWIKI